MKSQSIWLSYDMGLPGDYESLYIWLDQHEARVCGRSLAYMTYSYKDNLKDELTEDLRRAVDITPKVCLYLVYHDLEEGKLKGSYLFGRRRWTPWHGCAEVAAQDDC